MNIHKQILLVEDDEDNRTLLAEALRGRGYRVNVAASGEEAFQTGQEEEYGVVVSDIQIGPISGIEVLKWFRRQFPETPVLLLTAYGSVRTAVESMKYGAFDYLTKPINLEELFVLIERALEHRRLVQENRMLTLAFDQRIRATSIVVQNRAMVDIFKLVGRAAETRASILIYGETGTGKELIARTVHDHSPRAKHRFVAFNCAAVPDTLLESELFGHVKGAFTGANDLRRGLLEEASGGTVFLDEIGDLSPAGQSKLLRVLQGGESRRLGSNTPVKLDLRVVSASRMNLEHLVKEGKFREDLLYRLKTITIHVPPLRARLEELPLLAELFLTRYGDSKNLRGFSDTALQRLLHYPWPGNVRELEHVIERIATLASGPIISEDDLPPELAEGTTRDDAGVTTIQERPLTAARKKTAAITRDILVNAITQGGGNKLRTAEILGISRWALHRLLSKFGLENETNSPT